MSEKSSNNTKKQFLKQANWPRVVGLLLWVFLSFALAQVFYFLLTLILKVSGVPLDFINQTVQETVGAFIIYAAALAIALGVPLLIKKSRTTKEEMGMTRLPSWLDIGLAPTGFIIYLVLTWLLTVIVTLVVPGFDGNQVQEIGFANVGQRYEFVLAFFTLVVLAPLAEEMLFRGYLYGKLRRYVPIWVSMILTSLLFGLVHWQWNVAVDVFALSLLLCSLREITGNIWAGVLLHMIKNGIAFYLLFINPSLLNIMGG